MNERICGCGEKSPSWDNITWRVQYYLFYASLDPDFNLLTIALYVNIVTETKKYMDAKTADVGKSDARTLLVGFYDRLPQAEDFWIKVTSLSWSTGSGINVNAIQMRLRKRTSLLVSIQWDHHQGRPPHWCPKMGSRWKIRCRSYLFDLMLPSFTFCTYLCCCSCFINCIA